MRKYLKKNNYIFFENYNLKLITTIKNKGKCRYYVIINNYEQLLSLIKYLDKNKKKYLIIGNGSKLVFIKNKYNGVIITLKNLNKIVINNYIEVEAGTLIFSLINKLKKNKLGGIEELIGVPASIGGAIINNVSAHNVLLSEYLDSVLVIKDKEFKVLKSEEITFSYRHSSLKGDCIILKCFFKFIEKDTKEIDEKIKKFKEYRKKNQEVIYPNIGSIFKNNIKSASYIIKNCQLDNYKYKNVSFSKKHLNFLSIDGQSNGKYIYRFVRKVQKMVYKKTKIELESEINFIK